MTYNNINTGSNYFPPYPEYQFLEDLPVDQPGQDDPFSLERPDSSYLNLGGDDDEFNNLYLDQRPENFFLAESDVFSTLNPDDAFDNYIKDIESSVSSFREIDPPTNNQPMANEKIADPDLNKTQSNSPDFKISGNDRPVRVERKELLADYLNELRSNSPDPQTSNPIIDLSGESTEFSSIFDDFSESNATKSPANDVVKKKNSSLIDYFQKYEFSPILKQIQSGTLDPFTRDLILKDYIQEKRFSQLYKQIKSGSQDPQITDPSIDIDREFLEIFRASSPSANKQDIIETSALKPKKIVEKRPRVNLGQSVGRPKKIRRNEPSIDQNQIKYPAVSGLQELEQDQFFSTSQTTSIPQNDANHIDNLFSAANMRFAMQEYASALPLYEQLYNQIPVSDFRRDGFLINYSKTLIEMKLTDKARIILKTNMTNNNQRLFTKILSTIDKFNFSKKFKSSVQRSNYKKDIFYERINNCLDKNTDEELYLVIDDVIDHFQTNPKKVFAFIIQITLMLKDKHKPLHALYLINKECIYKKNNKILNDLKTKIEKMLQQ